MACGLPCVVSEEAGCAPDLVESGVTGETHPAGDVAALSRALRAVLERGPARGAASIRERISRFSVEAAADGVLEACRRVAK
jgi:glycosyltransferase involved in cell wall biosynthesis